MSGSSHPTIADPEIPIQKRQLVIHANYELFALALALLQVINSVLWLFLRNQEEGQVIVLISAGISLFFVVDSVYRLARAPSRRTFMFSNAGWLLWLGSLPLPFLALLRLLWYRLIGGRLRRSDYAAMAGIVIEKRAQSTLLVAALAAIIVLEAAAILILGAESGSSQANIQGAGDAVWWTVVTTATVGYGDRYPVTPAGRLIGVFVMIVGVGLFSVLTSFLAQWFLRSRQANAQAPTNPPGSAEEIPALLARLDALTALLEQQGTTQQVAAADLSARLEEIEKRLTKENSYAIHS
jgi:voltage-gated potassium channel